MQPKVQQPQNVIFWGAGATAALGIRTTDGQTKFIRPSRAHATDNKQLAERVGEALDWINTEPWKSALVDLITILGDLDDNYDSIDFIHPDQIAAMCRNWKECASDEELTSRIIYLRLIYDWPALKSVVNICPGISRDTFKLNDLFNLLDMHIPLGFGVPGTRPPGHFGHEQRRRAILRCPEAHRREERGSL